MNIGGGGGGGIGASFGLNTGFGDIKSGIFGGGSSQSTSSVKSEVTSADSTEKSKTLITGEALTALVQDALGQNGGLAAIFAEEQGAGLFGTSTSKQAAADLAADLVSEITKLTSEQVTEEDEAAGEITTSVDTVENDRDNLFESLLADTPF